MAHCRPPKEQCTTGMYFKKQALLTLHGRINHKNCHPIETLENNFNNQW